MATLQQIYQIRYTTTGLLHRATAAVMHIADYILTTEAGGTTNHANRVIWATQAVGDPLAKALQMMVHIATNGTIGAEFNPSAGDEGVPDADIQFVVETLVNTYATGA